MKKIKTLISPVRGLVLLSLLCLGFPLFAGGGGQKSAAPATDAVVEFPLKEKVTLTYWHDFALQASRVMDDYNGSLTYQELEKLTNVHINFIHPAQGQVTEQFNLMIASGEYPDLVAGAGAYPGGIDKAIEDGVYFQLNDLIERYAPNYGGIRRQNPQAARETVSDSGKIGAFYPLLRQENLAWHGPSMRKDWLDETGLPVPETIDDWDRVLRAVKKNHPDAVPLIFGVVGPQVTFKDSGIEGFGLFLSAWNLGPDYYREGNTIKYGPIQNNFKNYLALMNRWYKDGLIDKDFPARDERGIQSMITGGQAFAAGISIDTMNNLLNSQKIEWAAAPYPVLKKGDKIQYRAKDWVTSPGAVAVSTQCKNPAVAVKWLDYAYSEAGSMLFNFGKEGESYTLVNGQPRFTDLVLKNPNMAVESALFRYKMHSGPHLRWGAYSNPATLINQKVMDGKIAWTEAVGYDLMMPPVSLTADEGKEATRIHSVTNVYRNEMCIRFIMGETPLDKFADYVAEMKNMGIDTAIALYQGAYNRFMQRR
ncbi:MAG: extracellular solute-binding protein [Treponema sp.]|jgi:putative aldouronate transport system substrate-binding protein|nr:extracellular solute-binding protein [Treponema sp.]